MRTSVPAPSRLAMTLTLRYLAGILCCLSVFGATTRADTLLIEGVHVVPHQQSREMRYRQKTDFSIGARVELFLSNASEDTLVLPASVDVRLRGRTAESPFFIGVDPRVELFSIIIYLAGEAGHGLRPGGTPYQEAIARHFEPHLDHPGVSCAARLKRHNGIDYGAQMSLAVLVADTASLQLRIPLEPWPETLHDGWTIETVDAYLSEVRDFVRKTDFAAFLEAQRPLYAVTASRAEEALRKTVHLEWFDRYFGPRPNGKYRVFVSLLGGRGSFAFWVRDGAALEAICVTGAGRWAGRESTVVHEFAHSYVNPAAAPYLKGFEEAVSRMKPHLSGDFMRTIEGLETAGFVHESLTRAAVIRYLHDEKGFLAARMALGREIKNGLFWMPELLKVMEDRQARHGLQAGGQDLMPAFEEFVQVYGANIKSNAALARAGNAALPVCLALLGCWCVMLVVVSHRNKTQMSRLPVAGASLVLWTCVAEFIVLGNRSGLFGIVPGIAILLSALGVMAASLWRRPESDPPVLLSSLFVFTGVPLVLSASLAWGFCAAAGIALMLRMWRCRMKRGSSRFPVAKG